MSKSSDGVKNWRENTKRRMVQAMGGKCVLCGYDRCAEGMDFHHLDPSVKEFALGSVNANPRAWVTIVAELKKCVLLCCRCHREVHADIVSLPADASGFDPIWEDYRLVEAAGMTSQCPRCGSPKRPEAKHCSLRCAGSHRERFAWEDYDLDDLLARMTRREAADQIGCSLAGLEKHLRSRRRCVICGTKLQATQKKFCSLSCSQQFRRKVDWDAHDLVAMCESMSKKAIGRLLGVSDVAIHKRLRTLKLAAPTGIEPVSFSVNSRARSP